MHRAANAAGRFASRTRDISSGMTNTWPMLSDKENHSRASQCWLRLHNAGSVLFTADCVLVEVCALAQRRLGLDAVRAVHENLLPAIEVHPMRRLIDWRWPCCWRRNEGN